MTSFSAARFAAAALARLGLAALIGQLLVCMHIVAGADKGDVYTAEERAHWSLQPRSQVVPPVFEDSHNIAWLSNPIDAFILSRLKHAGLRPSPPADRPILVR